MYSAALRNTWIICKHECVKRVRTRSFLITTFLMPGFLDVRHRHSGVTRCTGQSREPKDHAGVRANGSGRG